jgi:hypothetical protein
MPESDAVAVDGYPGMEVGQRDHRDDLLGVDIKTDDRGPFGGEVLLDEWRDGAVPGFDWGLASVPAGKAADPLGKDHAIGAETLSDDERTTVERAVGRFCDLRETAGAELVEGSGNREGGPQLRNAVEALARWTGWSLGRGFALSASW